MDKFSAVDHDLTQARLALRRLADSAGTLVWTADANDGYTFLNREAADLFGKGIAVSFSMWLPFIHTDDRERVGRICRSARETREEYQVEYRIVKSDASIRWVMVCGVPRFSEDADFLGYSCTLIDITERREALNRLVQTEAVHGLLMENSSDLISHHSPNDGIYQYASPSFKRTLGFEPSELVGKLSVYDHVYPDDEKIIRDEVRRQLDPDAESRLIEFRVRHKDGHYLWMASNIRLLLDPVTKEKIGSVVVTRDVTSERQAREELRMREERFHSLTKLSSDWYWETNEEGCFTFMSDSILRIFGVPPTHFIGKTRTHIVADAGQPEFLKYLNRLSERKAFRDIHYMSNRSADGRRRHVSISGEPVFEQGVFKGYRGVGRDITDEMETAARLAQLSAENKALIENSLDMMALLDRKGRFLRVNDAVAEILGYRPEEILGRRYAELLHPADLVKARTLDADLRMSKHALHDIESRWIRKDGRIVHLSWSVRLSDDQRLAYASGRDVTERHHIRTALQQSKEQFHSMLESIGDAFFALDREWRITYANRKATEFVGVTQDTSIGRILWEAVPEILKSPTFPYYQEAMRTGRPGFCEVYSEPAKAWIEIRIYAREDGLSVYFHDVTDRREAESAIRASEQRLREVIEMTPAGYVLADAQGVLLDVNPAFCALSGYARKELLGQRMERLFPACPDNSAFFLREDSGQSHGVEAVLRHKAGHPVHALANANIKLDAEGKGLFFTGFLTDITGRKQAEARLEILATHDTLTGLPNRARLNERLRHMMDATRGQNSVAVMFIDLDRFKEVNDSMGHERGDILLREVARRLRQGIRPDDIVARLGGDEFVVGAGCSRGTYSAERIVKKLFAALNAPFEIADQEVFVSASIGISMFPQDGKTIELLFQNADTAMYRAKAAGRSGFRFFEAQMSVEAKTRMTLEHSLRRALERNELELHYQPRIDLKTGTVLGMEALLRWNHPQLGQVPPLQFISIAEETGLIEPIGRWVLQEACRQTRHLMDRLGRPLRVSVNLSARQLKCRDIVEQVRACLAESGLPPRFLELELTESALIEDMEATASVLKRLKKLGLHLSVDDFGTGYSGLAYLRSFPLDTLKLDRSFVSRPDEGISNFKFIKAFVDLAHALNLSVLAEGVETRESLQLLRDAACDEAQGYFFARPLPLHELEAFLAGL